MTVTTIRKKLKTYLDGLDDRKVKALYTLVEDEIERNSFTLTKEQLRIIDKEHLLHISGKTKSYNWEEAKEIIRG